ncbi:hypothetical protein BOTCAL_0125g00020 [Botryotinia calthae]|uniref:Uncharacterized protein n=1 Tax=Botryotinia calthae TaxID=38488 RepID=A0A4Y8D457_9HELO|nr:hypothetical protein BOTCAL_0125g00020 [Botryotinia calthae]
MTIMMTVMMMMHRDVLAIVVDRVVGAHWSIKARFGWLSGVSTCSGSEVMIQVGLLTGGVAFVAA